MAPAARRVCITHRDDSEHRGDLWVGQVEGDGEQSGGEGHQHDRHIEQRSAARPVHKDNGGDGHEAVGDVHGDGDERACRVVDAVLLEECRGEVERL